VCVWMQVFYPDAATVVRVAVGIAVAELWLAVAEGEQRKSASGLMKESAA